MKRLYEKDPVWFAVGAILVYVVGSMLADQYSAVLGTEKILTVPFQLALTAVLSLFVLRNGLGAFLGFRRASAPAVRFFWYIPLVILASVNLWFGTQRNFAPLEAALYFLSMVLAGFLEELVFRGFLFHAMAGEKMTAAVLVSGLTFGIGHIVNLLNGADLVPTLCQIGYAAAIGILFAVIVWRGRTIIPCILCHSAVNALSTFASNEAEAYGIPVSIAITILAGVYALWLMRSLPRPKEERQ